MPVWTLNKWNAGMSPDDFYGKDGSVKHLEGIRIDQDMRFASPANYSASPYVTVTTDPGWAVVFMKEISSNSGNPYMIALSTNGTNTRVYRIDETGPTSVLVATDTNLCLSLFTQRIATTEYLMFQFSNGDIKSYPLANLTSSSWTLTSVGTSVPEQNFGCWNVSLEGASTIIGQGNSLYRLGNDGTLTRMFYIGQNYFKDGITGITKFADQVRVYYSQQNPYGTYTRVLIFSASTLASASADSAYPSYSVDVPNVYSRNVISGGSYDYSVVLEHGYDCLMWFSGYQTQRLYADKRKFLPDSSHNLIRKSSFSMQRSYCQSTTMAGSRVYFLAQSNANAQGWYVCTFSGAQDDLAHGLSLRNYLGSVQPYSICYSQRTGGDAFVFVGLANGTILQIQSENVLGKAINSTGMIVTREFDAGNYSVIKQLVEMDLGVYIPAGATLGLWARTQEASGWTAINTSMSSTAVKDGRIRLSGTQLPFKQFNSISLQLVLQNPSSGLEEIRLYDINTRYDLSKQ